MAKPIAIVAQDAPPRANPEQFVARMVDRVKKPLGDLFSMQVYLIIPPDY